MNAKLLTESGWKAILSKNKIRDNGLQKALAAYEDLDEDAHDDCLEGIGLVTKLAGQLKRVREVAANKEVVDYLDDLQSAAETEERDVTKEKAAAAKAEAANQKKAQAEEQQRQRAEDDADKDEDEEDEDDAEGEYQDCLLRAFKKLKSMGGKTMQFIVCVARPFCGLMIARRISPKHKEQLTELTGGSKRFLRIGTCHADGDRFIFQTDQPVQGLARKLQLSVKNFTGKKLAIVVGDESAEDDASEESQAKRS